MSSLSPALERGIKLLNLLQKHAPLSLDELTSQSGYPKASVLRLLATLCGLGLVAKDVSTKLYTPLACLTPIGRDSRSMAALLPDILASLADETGLTAEWYIPGDRGMIMVNQAEPDNPQLRVHAHIGFIRDWQGELDAVCRVGRTFWSEAPQAMTKMWDYDESGERSPLKKNDVERILADTRESCFAEDMHYNPHGVRRLAVPVLINSNLTGVLAVDLCYTPTAEKKRSLCRKALTRAAECLSEKI